ncbi:MAG: hypothetical protein E6I00_00515 [Chloroflexi bacterium]|nr:MAG: hypothetical protein E6I00_00515 [Chloroflexota bacterium]
MEVRRALLWSGLLLGSQATDTLTTAIDRARGAVEAMPISAQMLEVGGVALFWVFKVMIVAAAAAALLAAAHNARSDPRRFSRLTFQCSLVAVQAVTICLAFTSLSNVAVLGSIVG